MPVDAAAAGRYVAETVLGEYLGLAIEITEHAGNCWRIRRPGSDATLSISDQFFAQAQADWLGEGTLPGTPLAEVAAGQMPFDFRRYGETLPVLFGVTDAAPATREDDRIDIGIDLFGGIFFQLSRYEEGVARDADRHGRFSARQSIGKRAGILDRPLVDEYVEVLWGGLSALWPDLERRPRQFHVRVTCDLDRIDDDRLGRTVMAARQSLGSIVKRRKPGQAWAVVRDEWEARRLDSSPLRDTRWLMGENERLGNQISFFVLAGRTVPEFDGDYSIRDTAAIALLHEIHAHGHEIGLHTSYGTLLSSELVSKERCDLEDACSLAGFKVEGMGARAHFLRWRSLGSGRSYDEAGLAYDSSLGFADAAGFRCGTSFEFRLFDLDSREPLTITERPLVLMDTSLLSPEYMGLASVDEMYAVATRLKDACRWSQGDFNVLWHNTSLSTQALRTLYSDIIRPN